MALILTNGTGGGLASQTTSWAGGVVPVENDSVKILSGDIIEVDGIHIWGDATATALIVENGGELTMSTTLSSSIDIKGGVTQFGTLSAGSIAAALPNNINTRISWNYLQAQKAFRWRVEVDGSIILHGSDKTLRTLSTSTTTSGGNVITLDDVTGWEVGDWVSFGYTHKFDRGRLNVEQIAAINGNDVTIVNTWDRDRIVGAHVFNGSQRLKIGARNNDEASDLFVYHNDTDTPSTTRYLNGIEVQFVRTSSGGENGFSVREITEISTVAWKFPFTKISQQRGESQYYISGFGLKESDHPYSPEFHDCVWAGIQGVIARSTTKFLRCGWHYGQIQSTYGDCVGLTFEECWMGGASQSVVGLGQAPAPTFIRCEFQCGYKNNKAKSNPLYIDCNWKAWYFFSIAGVASTARMIRNTWADHEWDPDTFEYGSTLKTNFKLSDHQNDPTRQYYYTFEGSYKRDTAVFRTKLASVRCSSRNQPSYPLRMSVDTVAILGSALEANFSIFIDASVTVAVEVELSNTVDSASLVVPLTVGWHDLTLSFVATTTSPTTLVSTLTDGIMWVDDVIINGVEQDLGALLFNGGTEISTVIDITDTSVPILAPNLIDGTRVQICNVTTEAELDNSVVTGGSGYSLSLDLSAGSASVGDVIRLRACHQSGVVAHYPIVSLGSLTSSGVTWIDEQVIDEHYGSIGIDGETVDLIASPSTGEIQADFANMQIDVNDPNNIFDARKGVSWWRYITTTESGIRIYPPEALQYNPDNRNILIDSELLQIENIKVDNLTITEGIWIKKNGESLISPTSNTIIWVPNDRVYQGPETGVSGLTVAESTKLSILDTSKLDVEISSIPAEVWNKDVSSHSSSGSFGEKVGKRLLTLSSWIGLK